MTKGPYPVKSFALLAAVILPFGASAGPLSLEDISPHLPSDARIIWKAPTNGLPKTLWTYRKRPQSFSAVSVSNALTLGAFELKPFPKSFTKPITICDKAVDNDPQPDYFSLDPGWSSITIVRERKHVGQGDADPAALVRRTWQYALQMGLDEALLVKDAHTDNSTISFPRKIDGMAFWQDLAGFSVQYGAQGEIHCLDFIWPKLERVAQERVVSPEEIIRCIRALKTPVLPGHDEETYFERVKTFASVQTLTITNITPYYSEGNYGEPPSDTTPETFVGPVAVLDAVADWGYTNAGVRLFSPLLSADVNRLLAQKGVPKN